MDENDFIKITYWFCSICGYHNHPIFTTCRNCNHPKLIKENSNVCNKSDRLIH